MRYLSIYTLILPFFFLSFTGDRFKTEQLRFPRVRTAYQEKSEGIKKMLTEKNINPGSYEIFYRVLKEEKIIELWARNKGNPKWTYVKSYNICQTSGELGPKRKRGDGQIPEGFYHIDGFNPQSNFYLSLRLNYPNASDKILANGDPGGDIFIHGNCITIGCMPMTDFIIKEMYILAMEAKNQGQTKIPVHIFPFRMNEENWKAKTKVYDQDPKLISFWADIKKGYEYFENNKTLPSVSVLANGVYSIK